jgi:molecular chaperone GrpE (heat shock protein)
MSLDKKILSEIKRYQSINKYISEQEAPLPPLPGAEDAVADEVTAAIPPTGAGEGAPAAPEAPTAPAAPEKIDIENDPDVEKLDADGESAEGEEGDGTEELEITDLVTSQKNIEQKQDEYFNNLFGQISKLEAKLSEMDALMNRLNTIENKIEKYREKTPQEKLELRTYDSYPFNQKLSDFFDDKKIEMEKTGKKDYVLTSDEVEDINPTDIRTSFQPGQQPS